MGGEERCEKARGERERQCEQRKDGSNRGTNGNHRKKLNQQLEKNGKVK